MLVMRKQVSPGQDWGRQGARRTQNLGSPFSSSGISGPPSAPKTDVTGAHLTPQPRAQCSLVRSALGAWRPQVMKFPLNPCCTSVKGQITDEASLFNLF